MIVVNRIAEVEALCGPVKRRRKTTAWHIVHKAGGKVPGWGEVEDVVAMAKFHRDHPEVGPALGHQLAYWGVIKRDGVL